jgi:cytochrome P450
MLVNVVEVLEEHRARLGPTFLFHFGGVRSALITSDPRVLEHVLKTNRKNYEKSEIQMKRMAEFQGKGLVNSQGEEWLRQRRLLAHGFRPQHLAALLPMQKEVLDDLMLGFDREAQRGPVDVHHQMVRFTLRLIGRSVFGRSMRDEELEQIADGIAAISTFILQQVVQPYKIAWYRLNGRFEAHQKLRRDGEAIVVRHIQDRLTRGGTDADFLRLLLETPYHDTGVPMSRELVLIESLQFMVAGNETSSTALTWMMYLLARHPRYVAEIRDEVRSVIGDNAVDFHNLHELKTTLRVIDESMRLYPPFWAIDRVALEDDEVAGVQIPAGTRLMPYIYGTHRNSEHWEDVETFDPRRFEPDRARARHPFAFVPFGGGPRICIGNNMAILQMLLIVVALVQKYDFTLTRPEEIGFQPRMLLRPGGPVTMTFRAAS